jgi:tetratricopeptide (TPR) repeat protein
MLRPEGLTMRLLLAASAAPLVLLCACQTAQSPQAKPAAEIATAQSAYGMFLAGEEALNSGKNGEAARFFAEARAQGGDDPIIADKAFMSALMAGDVQKAAAQAPLGPDANEATKRLGKLVVAVETLAEGKGKEAKVMLAPEAIAFPHKPAAALLAPWAAAQAGDVEGSLLRPAVRNDRQVDYFGQLGQALLYERVKRFDEAEADYKALTAGQPMDMAVVAYGEFLERRGRKVDAVALYNAQLAREPNALSVKAAKARAESGRPAPPLPTIREGAAQALLAPAVSMMAAKQTELSLAYLRLLLRLDPNNDEAWVLVGDVMLSMGDTDAARAAYARPKPGSLEYSTAQAKLAWSYQTADDKETALKLARAAAATGNLEARINLADILKANDQYAEAVDVMNGVIAQSGPTPDWRFLFSRGTALERLGRWPEAEADLQAALKQRPDEPELLNYLGYSWIDRGQHLTEALAMVQKAVAADPRSGAMVDSLGWAYYRLGDYKKAVEKLEEAVELEAGDPEINNHLGDAYWKVGRKQEAEFQWRRVLTLKPDDKIKASAEAKLASNLGPDGPTPKLADK